MRPVKFTEADRLAAACLLAFVTVGALAASNAHAANSADTLVQSNIDRTYAMMNESI